jgi:hypothetical protein
VRYGDPEGIAAEDCAGDSRHQREGRYEDYAKDPWKTVTSIFKRVDEGTYEYFYPTAKQAVRR